LRWSITDCAFAPRTGPAADHPTKPRFAGDQAAVLGLLQALKHASPANVAGLTVKLMRIPSGRSVQLIGFIIQFAGHTTHFQCY
jgi:hypothetical protein